jgi:hypothetical protein
MTKAKSSAVMVTSFWEGIGFVRSRVMMIVLDGASLIMGGFVRMAGVSLVGLLLSCARVTFRVSQVGVSCSSK